MIPRVSWMNQHCPVKENNLLFFSKRLFSNPVSNNWKGNQTTALDHIYPSCLHEGVHWIKSETSGMEEQIRASE